MSLRKIYEDILLTLQVLFDKCHIYFTSNIWMNYVKWISNTLFIGLANSTLNLPLNIYACTHFGHWKSSQCFQHIVFNIYWGLPMITSRIKFFVYRNPYGSSMTNIQTGTTAQTQGSVIEILLLESSRPFLHQDTKFTVMLARPTNNALT